MHRRVEDSNHRFEDLSRSMNQTEMMRRLNDECAERQKGDNAMHQLITSLAEQTNLALEEEASCLWEGLRTHNHDIMIDSAEQTGKKSIQIQALAGNGGFPGKRPRTIQLNPMPFSSPMPATYPSAQESTMMGCTDLAVPAIHASGQESPMMGYRDFAPRNPFPQVSTPMSQRTLTAVALNGHKPTYASMTTSRMQNMPANETSMYHQEVYPSANQFPQQSSTFNFGSSNPAIETSTHHEDLHSVANQFPLQSTTCNFGGGGQLRSLDQQPRIRISRLSANGM